MQVKQIRACKTKLRGRSMKKEAMAGVCYNLPPECPAAFNYINPLTRMESAFEHQQNNHKDFQADVDKLYWKQWMEVLGDVEKWKVGIPPSLLPAYTLHAGKSLVIFSIWLPAFEVICTAPLPCSITISQFLMLCSFSWSWVIL